MISLLQPWGNGGKQRAYKSALAGEVACRLPKGYDGRIVFSFGVNDTTLENGKTRVELSNSIENCREI